MNAVLPSLAVATAPAGPHSANSAAVDVRVDTRFELMSIVARLAGYREYAQAGLPDDAEAVDAYFGPFRDHRAVKRAIGLRDDRHVAYEALPNLAVRVKDAAGFDPIWHLDDPALGLDPRWDPRAAAAFLRDLSAFASSTAQRTTEPACRVPAAGRTCTPSSGPRRAARAARPRSGRRSSAFSSTSSSIRM